MSLFQHSVLTKYLKEADQTEMNSAYEKLIAYFHNPTIQQNIRNSKEEQFQEGFLRELFVNVLGYTINPNPEYNLTTEFQNERGARKADGAILKDGAAVGVIELKSTTTRDLESIRLQAFDYKANHQKCVYVITSNFEKLRFYINNAVEFEEFDLFRLEYELFQLLWLCLGKNNLLTGLPLAMKEASVLKEENVTKQIYLDYTAFKRDLYNDLIENNLDLDIFSGKEEKEIKLQLFKKSQKLIDRFLFIFFGEDRGLLPPNSISEIQKQWEQLKDLDEYKPLYDRFKKYFSYMNTGWKGQKYEIYAYNGGLFAPDEVLDSIKISDNILQKHIIALTTYDFESEVDVNILGHIFENSLNEIEEVAAQIEGAVVDLKKSKRKKDGIFYTPKYITKYIVENTVGKLCAEKKIELGIDEIDFSKNYKLKTPRTVEIETEISGRTEKVKRKTFLSIEGFKHLENLEQYRNFLLEITILDPACGSGAFLNQALDFLIKEHGFLTEQVQLITGDVSTMFIDIENQILENNIFGVDINDESVEIAKLSLWLRTAQKGRKLTTLSNNIKCGNSLIDDPAVAGEKAFNWQTEFPDVYANGGFDVVIGNPPYGAKLKSADEKFLRKNYAVASYQLDTYILFLEKAINLIKGKGRSSLIIPSAWVNSIYDLELREFLISKTNIEEIVIAPTSTFDDATVETIILTYNKSRENLIKSITIKRWDKKPEINYNLDYSEVLNSSTKAFPIYSNPFQNSIVKKIRTISNKLKDFAEVVWGVKVYENEKGIPPQNYSFSTKKIFHSQQKLDSTYLPLVEGKNIARYSVSESNQFLKYGVWLAAPRNPSWFDTKEERIVVREITSNGMIQAALIDDVFVFSNSVDGIRIRHDFNVNIKSLLAILNSRLISFYHLNSSPNSFKNTFPKVLLIDLRELPIPDISTDIQKIFSTKVELIQKDIALENQVLLNFRSHVQSKFDIKMLSTKVKNWEKLEFKEFLIELQKAKIKLTLSEEAEWMQYFNEQKQKAQSLKSEIDKTDREIDRMVYELYGLTEEEIKIVEESANKQ
jgi:type I restriction-modification system DNA methylase subunit